MEPSTKHNPDTINHNINSNIKPRILYITSTYQTKPQLFPTNNQHQIPHHIHVKPQLNICHAAARPKHEYQAALKTLIYTPHRGILTDLIVL